MKLEFQSATFVVKAKRNVVYDGVHFEPVKGSSKMYLMRGTQIQTVDLRSGSCFQDFFKSCSSEYQEKISENLRTHGFERFCDHLFLSAPIAYHVANTLMRIYTFGARGVDPHEYTRIVMRRGVYDTGFRSSVEYLVSTDQITQLEAVSHAGLAATNLTA